MKAAAAILGASLLAAASGLMALAFSGPSSEELRADIADADQRLARAEAALGDFGKRSPLHLETSLEIAVLRSTRAMLDQKLKSFLRGISLSYSDPSIRMRPPSPSEIARLKADLDQAAQKVADAEARAAQYTGGLLQVTALLEAQVGRVAEAIARQHLSIMRLGIQAENIEGTGSPPVGRATDDKGAL